MTGWTSQELDMIGTADELDVAVLCEDGTLRPYTTIWVVNVGEELYVRSYRGAAGKWYQAVGRRPEGRIRIHGVERDVTFAHAVVDDDAIDAAYRRKYNRYGDSYVDSMIAPAARQTTLQFSPLNHPRSDTT